MLGCDCSFYFSVRRVRWRNGAFASDSQAWIAERMCINNAANVSRIVNRMNPSPLEKEVSEELCRFIMEENEH